VFTFHAELLEADVEVEGDEDVLEDDPVADETGEDTPKVKVRAPEVERLGVAVTMLVKVFVTEASVVILVAPATELTETAVVMGSVLVAGAEPEVVGTELADEVLLVLGAAEVLEDEALEVDPEVDVEAFVPSIVKGGLMFPESPNRAII